MKSIPKEEKKESNIMRIAKYILDQGETTKNEIAFALNLSMPTTLQSVKKLINRGIVQEVGEYESTGGRKPKALSIVENLNYSVGIEITVNHIAFVIIDMKANIIKSKRIRLVFHHTEFYYTTLTKKLSQFIWDSKIPESKIIGVGISIPGIVISDESRLVVSHVLHLKDIDLNQLAKRIPYPVRFENDANSAALAEVKYFHKNSVYVSLSNSVGGSIYLNGKIYYGDFYRSGEFGHMVVVPNGKQCYCGKCGCIDAYCSAKILANYTAGNLKKFFRKLDEGDEGARLLWDTYLEYLSIAISNIHFAYDCEIILGGYVGSYIEPYIDELWSHLQKYLLFNEQVDSFLRPCHLKNEATGVGIATYFINQFIAQLH
jgi:predicted NBD/HSP70 family sugar kinase